MAKRKHTPEPVVNSLRQAEVALSGGSKVAELSRNIVVPQKTIYRSRAENGGWGAITADRDIRSVAGIVTLPELTPPGGVSEHVRSHIAHEISARVVREN